MRESVFSSFRDPAGFVFREKGVLRRQINPVYFEEFRLLYESGLHDHLVNGGMMVSSRIRSRTPDAIITEPEEIPLITYPYEWSFSMLKDAALLTLRIQKTANRFGMSLKDASAYNIQFRNGKPILIDTLSLEKLDEEKPWCAYLQFCRHFLAPLLLASYTDFRLCGLLREHVDGIPLDLASRLLPFRTYWEPHVLLHLHLHARMQKKHQKDCGLPRNRSLRQTALQREGVLNHLTSAVSRLKWRVPETEWKDYYTFTNYSDEAFRHKKEIVKHFLEILSPATLWDLGANNGEFTRLAAARGCSCAAFDIDPAAVEKNYRDIRESGESNLLPLLQDLCNPSPAVGWSLRERMSLTERGRPDAVMALALVHHLAISNNLPFTKLADFFAGLSDSLIIEFVPRIDSKVEMLLSSRKDIFSDYNEKNFERAFGRYFRIVECCRVRESMRSLYLMKK